jgi:hypothetical protein
VSPGGLVIGFTTSLLCVGVGGATNVMNELLDIRSLPLSVTQCRHRLIPDTRGFASGVCADCLGLIVGLAQNLRGRLLGGGEQRGHM